MNTSTKTVAVPNYSKEQMQMITDASPLNLEKAKVLADEMGKTYRSVIAKAKSMELEYVSKPAPRKKAVQATKSELVAWISNATDRDCDGLEKATRSALLLLINGIQHMQVADES